MSVHQRDPTFSTFTSEQAKHYANSRPSYPTELFQCVFDHHAANGGSFKKLLDVGCGPGKATRDMLPMFEEVIGIDAGPEMIKTARELGGTTKSGKEVQYEVSRAEEIDKIAGLQEETVDMITGATCAHWIDMSEFWPAAAKVLKPGGTVALWARAPMHCR
ncbi:S-adenosyl-L-methionine-dependent methyltransferase, partial [Viridothelium virens]